jgi:hypothetical protein
MNRVEAVRSRVPALVRRGARCCTTGMPCACSDSASISWQMGPFASGKAAEDVPLQNDEHESHNEVAKVLGVKEGREGG